MAKGRLPPAWDEERIRRVLAHYETQSDDEALAGDQTSLPQSATKRSTLGPGDQMTREVGWGVRDLYHASPENRQFLRSRLLHSPTGLEKYRRQVTDAVFPDPFSSKPVRVGEAERLIRHYRLSTGDESGTVDLMLAMVEAGTEQAVDLGCRPLRRARRS